MAIDEEIIVKIEATTKRYIAELKAAEKETEKARKGLKSQWNGFKNAISGIFQGIGQSIGNTLIGALGSMKDAIGEFVKQGIEIEQTRVAFENLIGSVKEAKRVMDTLKGLAAVTPFETKQVLDAGKALLAFGVEADSLKDVLTQVGNASAATGKDFNELAVIYGKARTAGTLYAEDINQLTEAGIPIIQELAKAMGVQENQVKKLGSEGKITFDVFERAFKGMTTEGGRFNNMMEAQSKTVGGALSTLKSNFDSFTASIGEGIGQALLPFIKGLNNLIQPQKNIDEITGILVDKTKEYNDIQKILTDTTQNLTDRERKLLEVRKNIAERDVVKSLKDLSKSYKDAGKDVEFYTEWLNRHNKRVDDYIEISNKQRDALSKLNKDSMQYNTTLSTQAEYESLAAESAKDAAKAQEDAAAATTRRKNVVMQLSAQLATGVVVREQLIDLDKDLLKEVDKQYDAYNDNKDVLKSLGLTGVVAQYAIAQATEKTNKEVNIQGVLAVKAGRSILITARAVASAAGQSTKYFDDMIKKADKFIKENNADAWSKRFNKNLREIAENSEDAMNRSIKSASKRAAARDKETKDDEKTYSRRLKTQDYFFEYTATQREKALKREEEDYKKSLKSTIGLDTSSATKRREILLAQHKENLSKINAEYDEKEIKAQLQSQEELLQLNEESLDNELELLDIRTEKLLVGVEVGSEKYNAVMEQMKRKELEIREKYNEKTVVEEDNSQEEILNALESNFTRGYDEIVNYYDRLMNKVEQGSDEWVALDKLKTEKLTEYNKQYYDNTLETIKQVKDAWKNEILPLLSEIGGVTSDSLDVITAWADNFNNTFTQGLEKQIATLQESTDAQIDAINDGTNAQVAAFKQAGDLEISEAERVLNEKKARQAEYLDAVKAIDAELRKLSTETKEEEIDDLKAKLAFDLNANEKARLEKEIREKELLLQKENIAEKEKGINQEVSDAESALYDVRNQWETELATYKEDLIKQVTDTSLSQEKTLRKQIAQAEVDLFNFKKWLSFGELAIQTSLAIARSIPNPVAIGAAIASGAAGAAVIAAQQAPAVPAFAKGGEFITNGAQLIMVGDNPSGKEHVKITPMNGNEGINTSGITVNFSPNSIVINGIQDPRAISGKVASGIVDAVKRNYQRL